VSLGTIEHIDTGKIPESITSLIHELCEWSGD